LAGGGGLYIRDLRAGMVSVTIEGVIVGKGEKRIVETRYGPASVCTVKLRDEAGGVINLSLWNRQIDEFGIGDRVRVKNGYVSLWRGELYVSTGRRGEVVRA